MSVFDIINEFKNRSDLDVAPGLSDSELMEVEGYIKCRVEGDVRDLLKGFIFSDYTFGSVRWPLDGGEYDCIISYFHDLRNYKESTEDAEWSLKEADGDSGGVDFYPVGVVKPTYFQEKDY